MTSNKYLADLSQLVELKHSLGKDLKRSEIMAAVISRIQQLPEFGKYRNNLEVVLLCCNSIENLIQKTDKIDKKELVLEILTNIFSLDVTEIELLKTNIEFLHTHNKIKKVGNIIKYFNKFITWFLNKIL